MKIAQIFVKSQEQIELCSITQQGKRLITQLCKYDTLL
jgi:hypothetical protein